MTKNDPVIGTILGDYSIESLLGQGGMARVYRGYDARLDRYAAVKVIEPTLLIDDDAEYRERFIREARAIARLNHPNIVNIFQFGQDEEESLYYMAMGFIDGRDLREIIKEYQKENEPVPHAIVKSVFRDIAEALDYAHTQGVIHRDVKPSNIMVTQDGQAILTDFGLALNAEEGTIGNTFGSVHYIAPEQAVSSAQAVPQSDLYALGVVLYELLTGRVPFEDVSAMSVALKHISDPPPLPSTINPTILPEVEEVLLKALDKDPDKRFDSGAAFVHALEGVLKIDESKTVKFLPNVDTAEVPKSTDEDDKSTVHDRPSGQSGTFILKPQTEPSDPQTGKKRTPLMIFAGLVVVALVIAAVAMGSGDSGDDEPQPTQTAGLADSGATVTPVIQAESAEEPEVLLRYNGHSLIIYNRHPEDDINIIGLEFNGVTTRDRRVEFASAEFESDILEELRSGDCFHVLISRHNSLPFDEFPADVCRFRQGFFSTVNTFWVSNQEDGSFQVRQGGEILAECPSVPLESEDEVRCLVDLPVDEE